MNLEEIENKRTEKQKELRLAEQNHAVVEDSKLQLQREILGLQQQKKDLEITLNKSMANIKQLKLDIAMLTNEFWSRKNS